MKLSKKQIKKKIKQMEKNVVKAKTLLKCKEFADEMLRLIKKGKNPITEKYKKFIMEGNK